MPGVSRDVYVIPKGASITSFIKEVSKLFASKIDVVIIDEVQFLTKEQVEELFRLALYQDLPIKTFGLLTNFQTELFAGSKRLIELGANQQIMRGVSKDGEVTVINARFNGGKLTTEGQEVLVGGNDKYKAISLKEYWSLLGL